MKTWPAEASPAKALLKELKKLDSISEDLTMVLENW